MTATGDAEYTQTILDMSGLDYTAAWQAHGQAWDDLVNEMWALYDRSAGDGQDVK
jgi:hypothetical protein